MDGTIFVLSGSENLSKLWLNVGHMLPGGSRDSLPVTSSNIYSSSCDWLDKSCEKFLSASSYSSGNIRHQSDYIDVYGGRCSSEFACGKDSTGCCNEQTNFGGRFFAWTGSPFVADDHSTEVITILSTLSKRNEKLDCFKCEGKRRALHTGAIRSSVAGQIDETIPAAGRRFHDGDRGNLGCGTNTDRNSCLQCQHRFLGSSFSTKTCRAHKESDSSLSKKVQAGSLRSCKTMVSCSEECFLSSSPFWNFPDITCSKSFLKDFEIWGKPSACYHPKQKLLASNDRGSVVKELVHFDRQSLCKSILEQANSSPLVGLAFSKIARHGFLSRGRGAVALLFKTAEKENEVIVPDFRVASLSYVYLHDSPANSECPGRQQSKFANLCQLYNPKCHYVISVTVDGYEEVCCSDLSLQENDLVSQMEEDVVARFCAKLPMYILHSLNLSLDYHGATLILTPVPGAGLSESGDEHKLREICFINIQQKLRQRGVSLRHQFPEVYRRLCAYTEMNAEFAPVSLFLFDSKARKRFLCLIMPNSEPFCSWMEELLEELGQETIV